MWNHYYAPWGGQSVYTQALTNVYSTLLRQHLQVDAIFAEHLERPDKLSPYRMLLAFNTESLTPGQETVLREWVRSGGTLIASAETSRHDLFGRKRDHYGLQDVFHAKFVRQFAPEGRVPLETYKMMKERRIVFSKEFGPGEIMGDALSHAYYGQTHTKVYDSDVVENLEGGRSAAKWNDGGDAAVWSKFGKGHCMFFGGAWLPLSQDFANLMSPTMDWVNQQIGFEPLLKITNAPTDLEFHVRAQPEKKRLVIHITNLGQSMTYDRSMIDPKTANHRLVEHSTGGVKVSLKIPDGWKGNEITITSVASGERIQGKIEADRILFEAPGFVMYSMIVVAF